MSGLGVDDKGTVTFSDATTSVPPIQIVKGVATLPTVDLSSLADGPIMAALSVSDAAGNTFTANAGATLDQDLGEQAALALTVNGGAPLIRPAAVGSVAFTLAGLEPDDTGTVTFTDVNKKQVSVPVTGTQASYTADLSKLAPGAISSSLALDKDTAGNSFVPKSGNTVTLGGTIVWALPVNGSWNTAAKWNPAVVPGPVDDALINIGARGARGPVAYTVTSSATNTVGSLSIGYASATLDITQGTFTLSNASSNAGTIKVEGGASPPTLDVLNSLANTGLVSAAASGATINLVGGSLSGGTASIATGALLEATGGASSPSTISGAVITNRGILEATNHTTLTLTNTTVNAVFNGIISLLNPPTIEVGESAFSFFGGDSIVLAGATINGGDLKSLFRGTFQTQSGTNSTLNGVTLDTGTGLGVSVGSTLTLKGTINNGGIIGVPGFFIRTGFLAASGTVTLNGNGQVLLTGGSIVSAGSPATLINQGDTIEGDGTIGNGDAKLTLNNNGGVIEAFGTDFLVVDTGNAVRNSATMEALDNSTMLLDDNVSNASSIASLGGGSDVVIAANTTITNTGSRFFPGFVSAGARGARVELQRGGKISGGEVDIAAGATVEADGGGTSTISGATVNDFGTLEATNDSILKLSNTTVNATGGFLFVTAGRPFAVNNPEILLSGATINGGTLSQQPFGLIEADAGTTSTLNGTTIAAGAFPTVTAGSTLVLKGTITNFGTMLVDANATLTIGAATTLTGGSYITLLGANSRITSSAPGGQSYLLTSNNAIAGSGTIGSGNGRLRLTNLGTINAELTSPLVINTGNQVANQGTMEATGTGGLTISDPVNNTGGIIEANGGNVTVGGNVSKGDIEIFGSNQVELKGMLNDSAVNFENTAGTSERLTLDHAKTEFSFTSLLPPMIQEISGFWGTVAGLYGSDPAHSDMLDLRDIPLGGGFIAGSTPWTFQENASGTGGNLEVRNGTKIADIALLGQYLAAGQSASGGAFGGAFESQLFHTASDGHGGTLVTTSFHT